MTWRFALLMIFAARSWACSCGGDWPSVKQAWRLAPAVFRGTVAFANPDGDANQLMFRDQSVRVHVDEAFKGVSAGQTIELDQGANDCSAKFRTGQTFVFYLYSGTEGGWVVPWCTHALGNGEPLGDDLLFLRALPKSAAGTRLSGTVELYERGIPNVHVSISGANGAARHVMTNANGVYELYGLPPGRYSVRIAVPTGLKIKFASVAGSVRVKSDDSAVKLARNDAASVGFVLQADTHLSGRMLDGNRSPIKGVCLDLEPVEGRGENGSRFFDCSKADGVFNMEMMPPGKYRLVAHDEVTLGRLKSKSTLYYPGVRDRESSTAITLEAGKYLDDLEMRLPSGENRYKIQGHFQFADGLPAADAKVTFISSKSGYTETTDVHADGSFGLSVVAGMEGQLGGELGVMESILQMCPELRVDPRRRVFIRFIASPVPVVVGSDREDLKLTLPSPSCESLRAFVK